jgi:thiol:disulfide interchange protein/DsbC/DsbD-like thiol-disulfide interchange protein
MKPLLYVAMFCRQPCHIAAQLGVFLAQLIHDRNQCFRFFCKSVDIVQHGANVINLNRQVMMARQKIFSLLTAVMAVLALGFPSLAQPQGLLQKAQSLQSEPIAREGLVRAGEVQAALVSEKTAARPGQPFVAGLRILHDPHWHTYWRNPGDSGLPTTIDWQLPDGWRAGPIQWPTPKRLPVGPLANFGFEGDLLLPVEIAVPARAAPGQYKITAKANWLVCKDVCIPGDAFLAITVAVTSDQQSVKDTVDAALFAQARTAVPRPDASRTVRAFVSENTLSLAWASQQASERPGFFYPYAEGLIHPAGAQRLAKTADGFRLDIALGESSKSAVRALRQSRLVEGVWAVSGEPGVIWRAALDNGIPPAEVGLISAGQTAEQAAPKPSGKVGWGALWAAMVGALVGGAILNLMPCVFPVIGLKVLSFAQSAHSRAGAVRHALVFSLGVVVSFLALAGLLLGLRAAGDAVGWGFQLQSPWVVLLLTLLFVAIAVNLFGVFEMGLLGTRIANIGFAERAASASGSGGAFASGVLAVVVASPCTAPFMGSAIGFTATAGVPETLAVFFALGLGMSLPYLILAAWPGLLRRMPRPGPWMVRFKQAMAFPMLAAAAWLLWVLANLQGPDVVLSALLATIAMSVVLWCYGLLQHGSRGIGVWIAGAVAVIVLVAAVLDGTQPRTPVSGAASSLLTPPSGIASSNSTTAQPAATLREQMWRPWAPGLPERIQAEGRTVFVDFTATWCISCQANKIRVLQKDSVIAAFAQQGVVTVRADWTRRDDQIRDELARHGRNGIPLYLVYPKTGGAPKILSEWLTEKEVMNAIQ